jgi:hypothetical protein
VLHDPTAKGIDKISGFNRGVVEAFALQRCYVGYVGSYLPISGDSLSVSSSRFMFEA